MFCFFLWCCCCTFLMSFQCFTLFFFFFLNAIAGCWMPLWCGLIFLSFYFFIQFKKSFSILIIYFVICYLEQQLRENCYSQLVIFTNLSTLILSCLSLLPLLVHFVSLIQVKDASKSYPDDPWTSLQASYASAKDVLKYITNLGISKVLLFVGVLVLFF